MVCGCAGCDLLAAICIADAQRRGPQPAAAAAGKGGDASRQSLESLRSENEALRSSISEAETAVGQLSSSGSGTSGGATAAGGPDSPEAMLDTVDNGAAVNDNKTSAGTASPSAEPSAEHPAGMPSMSNEHSGLFFLSNSQNVDLDMLRLASPQSLPARVFSWRKAIYKTHQQRENRSNRRHFNDQI